MATRKKSSYARSKGLAFMAKAGAKKATRRRRSSVAGKIMPPLDVRSPKHLRELKKRIEKGPVTFILVWATWCPHCHTMMPHFDAASKTPNRSVQSIKVEESMLPAVNDYLSKNINRSAKPINVEGFPSIIVVDKKGNTVTDVEPIRNTATMSKVMTDAGPLAEKAGINNSNVPNMAANESVKTSIKNMANENSTNKNKGLLANIGAEETGLAVASTKNRNIGEEELKGSIASLDLESIPTNKMNKAGNANSNSKKESLKNAIAPSPINTFSESKNKNNSLPSAPAAIKKEAEEITSLAAPMMPPNTSSDIENSSIKIGGGHGGSLYSSMARAAYTLAPAAALLATAAIVSKGKKSSTRKHSKKHRKTHRRRR
jgi:thiol-disulfide isomerase/thioredoxin